MPLINKYLDLKDKLTVATEDGKMHLLYDDNPMRIQTPLMYIPFGCRQYTGKYDKVTCTLDLSLRGHDEEDSACFKFKEWYKELEQQLIDKAELPEESFNSSLKNDNGAFPPCLRVKPPVEDGMLTSPVWLEHDEKPTTIYGNLDLKFKGNTAIAIITPLLYKLPQGMWGISWKVEQLRVFEPRRAQGFMFLE